VLDITWTLPVAFVSVVVFLILMNQIFFKRLGQFMEAREKRIEHDLAEAARLQQQAEGGLTTYQTAMASARRDAADQMAAAQRALEAKQRETVEGARGEATAMVTQVQATIAREAEETRGRLATEARALARLVAAKLVGR
jgi:F-type H+-transporting ATPase subunit b